MSYIGMVPVGSIIAWHKSLTGCPALPKNFVECNGQTLSDAESLFNGQVIPNLNGDAGGADSPGHTSKEQMYLRGGNTSGNGQTDAIQGHWHAWKLGDEYAYVDVAPGSGSSVALCGGSKTNNFTGANLNRMVVSPTTDGSNGTPRTANETRPKTMSVVWVMRIK